jgi:hypothetical protein
MKSSFLMVFLVGFSIGLSQKQIATQSHAWMMYFGNHRLTDRWGIHTEYQWRRNDFFQQWQQSLMRLGVDYYGKNGAQYTLGYGWIETFPYGAQPIAKAFTEHRIWQQLMLKSKVNRIDFQHRYRLEQRFLENWKTTYNGGIELVYSYLFRQRIRYRFLANLPINHPEMTDNTLFLSVYDEVFLGFGEGIGKNVLDQNRLYAAIGWRFNANVNVQVGYLNQYIIKTDGFHHERNHTLQIGFTYNLDFRKESPASK